MGITGLIKFVEDATESGSITSLKGSSVAVDSYCLLHKGSYSCAEKLIQGVKTNMLIDYAMKYVKMLLSLKIRIIMVFDGRRLKAKAGTEAKRRHDRETAKVKALQLLKEEKYEDARKEFSKAVNITHEHALQLMEECRRYSVNSIVAMYEADAQLAYLNKIGLAEYVISEDSDLILFGCEKIIFKLGLDGNCLIYDQKKLHLVLGKTPEDFSFEKFRRICILSGCDYIENLPGVGLKRARKFMNMTHETDMKIALPKITSYLNLKNVIVTQEYVNNFLKAEATFKYMYVFDPIKKKMVRLNTIEDQSELMYCENAGDFLQENQAYQLALGNLNPNDLKMKVNDYDPTKPITRNVKTPSIYSSKNDQNLNFNFWLDKELPKDSQKAAQQSKIGLFFFKKAPRPEIQHIIEEENKIAELEMKNLISSYSGVSSSKRSFSTLKTDDGDESCHDLNISSSTHNPFAKRQSLERENKPAENLSLIKSISTKCEKKVVSRFFKAKTQPSQPQNLLPDVTLEERLENNLKFYELTKGKEFSEMRSIESQMSITSIEEENDDISNTMEIQNEILTTDTVETKSLSSLNHEVISLIEDKDDDDGQQLQSQLSVINEIMSQSKTKSKSIGKVPSKSKFGLKRKASSTSISESTQSKLSKFGFIKKDVL